MSPVNSSNNSPHSGFRNFEYGSEHPQIFSSSCSNSFDLFHTEFGHPVPLAERLPAFPQLVVYIVLVGADVQVTGPNTARVVAGVQHVHSLRDLSVDEFPRDSVRACVLVGESELPVSCCEEGTSPGPAGRFNLLGNLAPKAICCLRIERSHLGTSMLDWSGVAGGFAPTTIPKTLPQERKH